MDAAMGYVQPYVQQYMPGITRQNDAEIAASVQGALASVAVATGEARDAVVLGCLRSRAGQDQQSRLLNQLTERVTSCINEAEQHLRGREGLTDDYLRQFSREYRLTSDASEAERERWRQTLFEQYYALGTLRQTLNRCDQTASAIVRDLVLESCRECGFDAGVEPLAADTLTPTLEPTNQFATARPELGVLQQLRFAYAACSMDGSLAGCNAFATGENVVGYGLMAASLPAGFWGSAVLKISLGIADGFWIAWEQLVPFPSFNRLMEDPTAITVHVGAMRRWRVDNLENPAGLRRSIIAAHMENWNQWIQAIEEERPRLRTLVFPPT